MADVARSRLRWLRNMSFTAFAVLSALVLGERRADASPYPCQSVYYFNYGWIAASCGPYGGSSACWNLANSCSWDCLINSWHGTMRWCQSWQTGGPSTNYYWASGTCSCY